MGNKKDKIICMKCGSKNVDENVEQCMPKKVGDGFWN